MSSYVRDEKDHAWTVQEKEVSLLLLTRYKLLCPKSIPMLKVQSTSKKYHTQDALFFISNNLLGHGTLR